MNEKAYNQKKLRLSKETERDFQIKRLTQYMEYQLNLR